MAVRILVRAPGQQDRILTLLPRHYERFTLDRGDGPPHISIMLLEDATGAVTHDPAMHIDEQAPAVVEQLGLDAVIGGAL
jgi:hypothetical protein